jgi:hypothetical protein
LILVIAVWVFLGRILNFLFERRTDQKDSPASIVREYPQRNTGDPLVKDLATAVIRGLSAAVVVFLSVKGGLALFTTQDVEPNSYVLFFTCLVGAVFSENIGEWAQEKLKEKFTTNKP